MIWLILIIIAGALLFKLGALIYLRKAPIRYLYDGDVFVRMIP